jgi:hypothetical protein
MTPSVQSKIETYDRYICDGIFEYLEDTDVITENQSDTIESQMDDKRISEMKKVDTSSSQPTNQPTNQPTTQSSDNGNSNNAKIGFWDWS